MIFTTIESVPDVEIIETLGVVTGSVVQSKHLGRDIMATLKMLIGGELRGYTEMLTDARNIAIRRLVEEAEKKGANGVIGIRFTTSAIAHGASELLVYGTAVKCKT
tara:strand:- start:81 stop:398 length:318 start_codon:yes stop_codon:yes gene_type:complete